MRRIDAIVGMGQGIHHNQKDANIVAIGLDDPAKEPSSDGKLASLVYWNRQSPHFSTTPTTTLHREPRGAEVRPSHVLEPPHKRVRNIILIFSFQRRIETNNRSFTEQITWATYFLTCIKLVDPCCQ